MRKFKDIEWNLANTAGNIGTWEMVQIAVLMDIRDELKRLNAAIYCPNFLNIPRTLQSIRRNTAKKKKKTR